MNNIMIQGTGSTVGKSLLTAAICRILKQDNISVAPFKSQNMALNSFVTSDGKEMGRAQVVQAEAAMIKPMVEMNPILLKPTSDKGSQVIVHGKIYSNLSASVYHNEKPKFKEYIMDSYNKLNSIYDVIVIEGAGSPAEINLRDNDLVNMGMAEMVDAPVILVGDIDKGGVFASIYGTVMLLPQNERKRIKGYVINKFRGDVNLLKPGIDMFKEKLDIPCLGVIPYMEINIDDEDSVTDRFSNKDNKGIIIGVIKLPYMSNFTDFTALEIEEDISVKYINNKNEFKNIDLLVIPGSKNTLMDMKYIHDSGIDKEIYINHREGVPIIGICGGFQILGEEIFDPYEMESSLNRVNGLSLLNVRTIMKSSKKTIQTSGEIIVNNGIFKSINKEIVSGYEIHMGETQLLKGATPFMSIENNLDGAINDDGDVFGTYLHGIFDNDNFRNKILNVLRMKKGLSTKDETISFKEMKENEYNKLASIVRNNLDVNMIKDIIGI